MTARLRLLALLGALCSLWPCHARADGHTLDEMKARAQALAPQASLDARDVTRWMLDAAIAMSGCDAKALRSFDSDPSVARLLAAAHAGTTGQRVVAAPAPSSTAPPAPSSTAPPAPSSTAPPAPSGNEPPAPAPKPHDTPKPVVKNPVAPVLVKDSDERLDLARAELVVRVRYAVSLCGKVSGCPEGQPAIDAVKAYIQLLVGPKVSKKHIAEFADALSRLGNVFIDVPQGELEGALVIAGRLSNLDPEQARTLELPENLREIMKEPPTPERAQRLLDALLEWAKQPRTRDAAWVTKLSETLAAARDMEARIKSGEVKTLLLDTEPLERYGAGCALRARVVTSAKTHLSERLGAPPLRTDRKACEVDGCDVEFAFRVDRCVDAPEGSPNCLRLGLRIGDATNDAIGAKLTDQCIPNTVVPRMIDEAFASFERALRAQDTWSGATYVPKGGIRVGVPKQLTLPSSLRGLGIHLVANDDARGMTAALEQTFKAVSHRGTGTVSARSIQAPVALRWRFTGDEGRETSLNVQVWHGVRGPETTLLEFDVLGDGLEKVPPEVLASHVTAGVIRYYEAQEQGGHGECVPGHQGWGYSLLLAGFRKLHDCDRGNDGGAERAAIIDGSGMAVAAIAGIAGFAARNGYSRGDGRGWLDASTGLYIAALTGLATSVVVKVAAW